MFRFPKYRTSFSQFVIALFSIVILFSCEVEDYETEISSLDFEISQSITLGETIILEAEFQGDFDSFEWIVSDGSIYQGLNSKHIFSNSGFFTITLNAYNNDVLVSSHEQTVQVLCEAKTLELYGRVNKALYTEGKIVLNTINENGETQFLFLNEELVLEKEVASIKELSLELETALNIGDSVLAFNQFNTPGYSYMQLKSTNELNKATSQADFIDYNNGLIYLQRNSNNQLFIDYYNEFSEKLWTKSFGTQSGISSEHVFSLNNQLFYLSFTNGELYIEKFKNPSVVFQQKTISFNTQTTSEIIFVSTNSIFNTIHFGLYNAATSVTSIYTVDENCSVQLAKEINGKMQIDSQFITPTGDIVAVSDNMILKYDNKWDVLAEAEKVSTDIGVCQIGENLILLYENLPSGNIRLSYLDKHLQPVSFE